MTTTKVIIPPISQRLVDDSGQAVKEWYDKLKFLEKLQPLSDIPAAAATVTAIDSTTGAFTLGNGLSRSSQDLRVSLTSITAALGADVAMNNTANYFDGPSVAQGTTGTWFVSGSVTLTDTSIGNGAFTCKLWDGTTVLASGRFIQASASNLMSVMALSGVITSPAGNLRISCKDTFSTSGKILFNATGESKDSTITAVRIA